MDTDFPDQCWFKGRARLIELARFEDARGVLVALEDPGVPFPVRRVFVVGDVPEGGVRGRHAHRTARQVLVCLAGRIDVEMRADDEIGRFTLDRRDCALLLEPGVWASQTYSSAAMLLVLSDEAYDAGAYVDQDIA